MHVSAKPLIETCSPDIIQKIYELVHQAEIEWKNTNDNIRNLRDKYERALDLWRKYRNSSDAIKNWAADRMETPLDINAIEVISFKYIERILSIICLTKTVFFSHTNVVYYTLFVLV